MITRAVFGIAECEVTVRIVKFGIAQVTMIFAYQGHHQGSDVPVMAHA